MSYSILRIPRAAYAAVRQRIVDIDARLRCQVYQRDMIRPARALIGEHIVCGDVALEADHETTPGDVRAALEVLRGALPSPEAESAFYALEALLT